MTTGADSLPPASTATDGAHRREPPATATAAPARAPWRPFGLLRPHGMYRPDIDGLRALAVIAVLIFHYAPGWLPGGFIGVDVFFVISGFLITGILVRSFAEKTFAQTILSFYQHRLRRIFPAVALVLGFCLVIGWLTLFPAEFQALGQSVAGAAGFVENILLWRTAGYFDTSAAQKPLLHFWSLAVEEQFYIFWPLALWVILRRRWPLLAAIVAIAGASFLLNIWAIGHGRATAAFYLPLTRTWELMVGAWLAVAHRRPLPQLGALPTAQAFGGLLLILLGLLLIRPGNDFPGWWALLPVAGTALLINAGPHALLNRSLFSWQPAVWIGLISYPLYLWHWVLLSFVMTLGATADHATLIQHKLLSAVVSLLLAWGTYLWLEQPIRRHGRGRAALVLLGLVALIGGAGLLVAISGGAPGRTATIYAAANDRYVASAITSPRVGGCFNAGGRQLPPNWTCTFGDKAATRWIMLLGDSHALALMPALDRYGSATGTRIVFAARSMCPALAGIRDAHGEPTGRLCAEMVVRTLRRIEAEPAEAIVLAGRWARYVAKTPADPCPSGGYIKLQSGCSDLPPTAILAHGLRTTLQQYARIGVPVLLVADIPNQTADRPDMLAALRFADHDPEAAVNRLAIRHSQHLATQRTVNCILAASVAGSDLHHVINLDAALCDADICPIAEGGRLLYRDDDHLSIAGALKAYPALARQLDAILPPPAATAPTP